MGNEDDNTTKNLLNSVSVPYMSASVIECRSIGKSKIKSKNIFFIVSAL